MLAKAKSYSLTGLDGFAVDVEVDVSAGIPRLKRSGFRTLRLKSLKSAFAPR